MVKGLEIGGPASSGWAPCNPGVLGGKQRARVRAVGGVRPSHVSRASHAEPEGRKRSPWSPDGAPGPHSEFRTHLRMAERIRLFMPLPPVLAVTCQRSQRKLTHGSLVTTRAGLRPSSRALCSGKIQTTLTVCTRPSARLGRIRGAHCGAATAPPPGLSTLPATLSQETPPASPHVLPSLWIRLLRTS